MEEQDLATILSELPVVGAEDTVAQVMNIYRKVMEVYEPVERTYQATLDATRWVTSSSTSSPTPGE